MINTDDLDRPIAERRKRRKLTNQNKKQVTEIEEQKEQENGKKKGSTKGSNGSSQCKKVVNKKRKSQERGWYRVQSIKDHRLVPDNNKLTIELKVKWEDYEEPTWEGFTGFVKDTAPMVERYLIKKSLMKTIAQWEQD